jgi:hypothetical protein
LGVFFRNNHFGTIFKIESSLYVLATDIGFAGKGVVWERLDEVNGDTVYCDANFKEIQIDDSAEAGAPAIDPAVSGSYANQEDLDYELALQMQREADNAATQAVLQRAAAPSAAQGGARRDVSGPGVAPVGASGQVHASDGRLLPSTESDRLVSPQAAAEAAPKKKKKKSACTIQ